MEKTRSEKSRDTVPLNVWSDCVLGTELVPEEHIFSHHILTVSFLTPGLVQRKTFFISLYIINITFSKVPSYTYAGRYNKMEPYLYFTLKITDCSLNA
jgi:hypothetical protein